MMRQNGGWVRLYCDILENPKLRTLSESTQLFFFWCLCLHKRGWLVGRTDGEIAYSLRLKISVVVKRLNELKASALLLSDNTPKGWCECQYASDSSAERMRNWRSKHTQERHGDGNVTVLVQDVTDGAQCHSDVLEQNRTEQSRAERARGEKSGDSGDGETGALVKRCEEALVELRECGPEWNRLTLEILVDVVRGHPKADLKRVVERVKGDWRGQPLPAIKTPPMIVRQALTWDEVDQEKAPGGARKNAASPAMSVEELRMQRIGGGR
jgi:hypothetical protein